MVGISRSHGFGAALGFQTRAPSRNRCCVRFLRPFFHHFVTFDAGYRNPSSAAWQAGAPSGRGAGPELSRHEAARPSVRVERRFFRQRMSRTGLPVQIGDACAAWLLPSWGLGKRRHHLYRRPAPPREAMCG